MEKLLTSRKRREQSIMTSTKQVVSSGAKAVGDTVELVGEVVGYASQELKAIKQLSNIENVIEFEEVKAEGLTDLYEKLEQLEAIEDPKTSVKMRIESLKKSIALIEQCAL